MMSRSSPGRMAATVFCRSRNLVTVRTLVAICWRRVAMRDYIAHAFMRRFRGPAALRTESQLVQLVAQLGSNLIQLPYRLFIESSEISIQFSRGGFVAFFFCKRQVSFRK